MSDGIKWVEVNERARSYQFPSGERYTFKDVLQIEIRKSGKTRIETKDGKKAFVNSGWEVLEIDADAWTC